MAKPPRPWTVTAHHPIEKLEDNLWAVSGAVPGVPLSRRMVIIKRSDGTLLFFQAIPVDEASLAEILAWGKPGALVVPHDSHGIDATAFAQRLGMKIYGPRGNDAKLRAKFELAGNLEDLPADPAVTVESMPGVKNGEAMAIVRSGAHVSLVFADVYQDNENPPLMFKLMGFGGGPRVVTFTKLFGLSDRPATKARLEQLAALPGLTRLIPCHGRIHSTDAAGTLKQVAASL